MTRAGAVKVDNPFFARVWPVVASHETEAVRALRRENLAGLSGRVLEVGAGIGTNFPNYPASVKHVLAVEPEPRLAEQARAAAAVVPTHVDVVSETAEGISGDEPFDAIVCSLVLCSVHDPVGVLRRLYSLLRPGGELRYLEHVASAGARGRFQRLADATLWPRLFGNCHTHRDTERSIIEAGFEVDTSRREWTLPAWAPMPVSELLLGRARRP
ncbi:class I SAM-dependent methyltransferase [Mycobacterium sp. Marseille-P9652]|uniref:class I SAM-dependent methyltransferase n=1 Tax=Mycobacterium sp. Marseille-P9652 TaxID=2654950 RepID=UPI0012E8CD18|nr:class I SAM-dependent methyltransferase [Mycobacterium sp. Marseille-P9652]